MCLSRCCCCIPLRHGLLTWGYIKLILALITIGAIILEEITNDKHRSSADYATSIIVVVLNVIDVVFTIILIVAGHMKNKTLFTVYYGYNITYLVLTAIVLIGWIVARVHEHDPDSLKLFFDLLFGILFAVVYILFSIYIVLLLRSQINKLGRQSYPNVQFTKPGGPYYNVQQNYDA